jgi:hypothetical protein
MAIEAEATSVATAIEADVAAAAATFYNEDAAGDAATIAAQIERVAAEAAATLNNINQPITTIHTGSEPPA